MDSMLYYKDKVRVHYRVDSPPSLNVIDWPAFRSQMMENRVWAVAFKEMRADVPLILVQRIEIDMEYRGTMPQRATYLFPDLWPVRFEGDEIKLRLLDVKIVRGEWPASEYTTSEQAREYLRGLELGLDVVSDTGQTIVRGLLPELSIATKLALLFTALLTVGVVVYSGVEAAT